MQMKMVSNTMIRLLGAAVMLLAVVRSGPVRAQGQAEPRQCADVRTYLSVLDPKTVEDVFGKRIGGRFVAIQVTIPNKSDEFQFLIHDVSLNLKSIYLYGPPVKRGAWGGKSRAQRTGALLDEEDEDLNNGYELSSLELSLLRGVAEKGQGQDSRNAVLRWFRGIGTVAAGLIGVASFGPSYPESVAVFNGPVISAYMDVFPDYTINQLNRLNDSAYKSNTLIPKEQAKVLVAFIPQAMFMDREQRSLFKKSPVELAAHPTKGIDFRRAQACVDGSFITEVEDMPPTVTGVQIEEAELIKLQDAAPEVRGSISGRFLTGAQVDLASPAPADITVVREGTPSDRRLDFVIKSTKPIPPGTPLTFQVSNDNGVQLTRRDLRYMPKRPTLTGVEPDPAGGERGSEVTITLTGTNFIPNTETNRRLTRVIPQAGSGVRVVSVEVLSGTSLEVTLAVAANAPAATSRLRVANDAGESAETIPFTVTAPQNP